MENKEERKEFVCPRCGCQETKHIDAYYEEPYGEIEYTLACSKCEFRLNHFAYGEWELEFAPMD